MRLPILFLLLSYILNVVYSATNPKEEQVADIICKPIACPFVECPKGTTRVIRGCACPKCVPNEVEDPSSESARLPSLPPPCTPCGPVQCAAGTRLVTDPTKCKSPKCVRISTSSPSSESARLPSLPPICDPPADPEVQCGRGTKLVKEKGRCKCPKCVPETDVPSTESLDVVPCKKIVTCRQVLCAKGTIRVPDPTGCSCPECVPLLPLPPPPCKPLACPQVLCAPGSKLAEKVTAEGCTCPTCECEEPKFCPTFVCLGTIQKRACECPICLPPPQVPPTETDEHFNC